MNRKNGWSCSLILLLVAGQVAWIGGCGRRSEAIPSGSFRAVVEDVVDDRLVVVRQLVITASGSHVVNVLDGGGRDQVFCNPDPKTGLMTARVVFLADLIPQQSPSDSVLRWMVRMTSGGATVGGPGLSQAGSAKSLGDVLSLGLHSGVYPLGQDIELGQVQGRKLVLRVD